MRRLLHEGRFREGFTLVELLVVAAVMAFVLTSMCEIYMATAAEWSRQQGQGDALVATGQACSRIADYAAQSINAVVIQRFTAGDTFAVNLPLDRAYNNYVPTWTNNKVQYRGGGWMVFYLSDSTGSYSSNGNILWAGTLNWADYPNSVVPDRNWSMYYNTSIGRISPITSLTFTMTSGGKYPKLVITVISTYAIRKTIEQITQSRTVCLRNAE